MSKALGIIVISFGVISCALFFVGGYQLNEFGSGLTLLRSRGGETVAEAYYQKIGYYGTAYAMMSYAFGTLTLAVSIGIGGLLLKKQ